MVHSQKPKIMKAIGFTIFTLIVLSIACWNIYLSSAPSSHPNVPLFSDKRVNSFQNKSESDKWEVSNRGYWVGLGAAKGHNFDAPLAQGLLKLLQAESCQTVLKLGGGTGAYSRYLNAHGIFTNCYDGNPNTQENTNGSCAILDFSKPLDLSPADWVISLEVGEHIPAEFESVFIQNIQKHVKKGVILSWSVEGQDGTGHVNNRNNDYIRGLFHSRGYVSNYTAERELRKVAILPWFKNTIMVFKKV